MSSNEQPKPEFNAIPGIIIAQHNGTNINFAFQFSVDQQTTLAILRTLHSNLTEILKNAEENEKNQKKD